MNEQNIDNSSEVSLLQSLASIDLTSVERNFPIMVEQWLQVRLEKITPEENKKKTGYNLVLEFATVKPQEAKKGNESVTLNPGFKLTSWASLVKSDKFNPLENLADLQLACLGVAKQGFQAAELIGKELLVKIIVDKMEDGKERNSITRYKALPAPASL